MVDILVIAYCILFICQIQIFLMLSTLVQYQYICELKFIFNFYFVY